MPPTPQVSITQSKPSSVNTQAAGADLIDFGDEVTTPKAHATEGNAPSISTVSSNEASLMDLQSPIVRRDTGGSSDEFVDAES